MASILVVEDDVGLQLICRSVLEKEGYQVTIVNNGRDGIDAANKLLPDLILMDIWMPELNGWQTAAQLKGQPQTKDIPIIMVTSAAIEHAMAKSAEVGCDDYIVKPFKLEELRERVAKVLAARSEKRDAGGVPESAAEISPTNQLPDTG